MVGRLVLGRFVCDAGDPGYAAGGEPWAECLNAGKRSMRNAGTVSLMVGSPWTADLPYG